MTVTNTNTLFTHSQERTKNAQFIIISLRNNMFELADRLVGIYKTSDVTKSVAINPSAFALKPAAAGAAAPVEAATSKAAGGGGAAAARSDSSSNPLGDRTNVA